MIAYLTSGFFIISTHAPRTGSDPYNKLDCQAFVISTHAPRTGSDFARLANLSDMLEISTHAPRTGSDAQR